MRFNRGRYGYVALALADSNVIKTIEATHSAKPQIMQPPQSLIPPTPRPGYAPTNLPTWCGVGGTCDGVLAKEYQRRMGDNLPPTDRGTTIIDPMIARLS